MGSSEAVAIRNSIRGFLDERLQLKLDGLKKGDPEYASKRESLVGKFQQETWVADAARRVTQLQVVTHSLKPIHPDARGTSFYREPGDLPWHDLLGSHLLDSNFDEDVVGNAAALDVYKFLKIEFGGKSLLQRALDGDAALVEALSNDTDKAKEWVTAFAAIVEPKGCQASDTRAKQIYWLVGDDPTANENYYLLAPLYATSLAHLVYRKINQDRFDEGVREARKAKRENRYSEVGYRIYPDLAAQQMGGTKPQNISQLNSERRGTNYLLASLPPSWVSSPVRPPFNRDSFFSDFGRRRSVRGIVARLRAFLESNPPSNQDTRRRRDALVAEIIDELMRAQLQLQSLEPGWSANSRCRLPLAECLWLDPDRAISDDEFAQEREKEDWIGEVFRTFGNWLNHDRRLGGRLPLGDPEHAHWAELLEEIMNHA